MMDELKAIKILESKFDNLCGNYLYQNAEKLEYEDALYAAISDLRAQHEQKQNGGWISVKDDMPKEHDSMFAKLFGTSKWNQIMFRKVSDEVNICGVYPDGKSFVTHCQTHDGKWVNSSIFQMTITHWRPLPEPPKEYAK